MSSSSLRAVAREQCRAGGRVQVFVPGLAFVVAVAAELRRAIAAMERYEQLKRTPRAGHDPEDSPARRVYVEFYSDG